MLIQITAILVIIASIIVVVNSATIVKLVKNKMTDCDCYDDDMEYELSAPWYSYTSLIKAFFENDPDVEVGELVFDDDEIHCTLPIVISTVKKFLALSKVLVQDYQFGNISFELNLQCKEDITTEDKLPTDYSIQLFDAAFRGNPFYLDSVEVTLPVYKIKKLCVIMKKEIVQFYDDDTSDAYGNENYTAEDALRVISNIPRSINISTSNGKENN